MGFAEAVRSGFGNYANFAGRAARPAYWWWMLFGVLVGLATRVLDGLLGSSLVRTTLYGTEVSLGAVTVLVGLALLLLCFIPGLVVLLYVLGRVCKAAADPTAPPLLGRTRPNDAGEAPASGRGMAHPTHPNQFADTP